MQLRQPFCINDVAAQWALLDRRAVYAILRENGIPTPPGLVFVNRDEQDEPPPRVEEVHTAAYCVELSVLVHLFHFLM